MSAKPSDPSTRTLRRRTRRRKVFLWPQDRSGSQKVPSVAASLQEPLSLRMGVPCPPETARLCLCCDTHECGHLKSEPPSQGLNPRACQSPLCSQLHQTALQIQRKPRWRWGFLWIRPTVACYFPSKTLLGLKQSHSLGLEVTIKIILGIGWDLPGRFFSLLPKCPGL